MSLANRLKKRKKHLAKFARRWPTDSYRVYDRDMPEYPWTIDLYADQAYLQLIRRHRDEDQLEEVLDAIIDVLGVDIDKIHYKERKRQDGHSQYEKAEVDPYHVDVTEGGLTFRVDLDTYIDTGLFLDHRNLRRIVGEQVETRVNSGGEPRVLNLFCYTGAFSVWAASKGAKVDSVDMSNTYLEWTKTNFALNNLSLKGHEFIRADIMRFLPAHDEKYDIIVLDPPTFSRSKKMTGTLDIQRDHPFLIKQCLRLLNRGGVLYFSTNLRSFQLEEDQIERPVEEITSKTVPEDFRPGIHRAFRIR